MEFVILQIIVIVTLNGMETRADLQYAFLLVEPILHVQLPIHVSVHPDGFHPFAKKDTRALQEMNVSLTEFVLQLRPACVIQLGKGKTATCLNVRLWMNVVG